METKSSKQSEGWAISLWNKYRTDIFFRTTCNIIVIQITLTAVMVIGLWFVMEHLIRDTSQSLISTFTQLLQGQNLTADNVSKSLTTVRTDRFWPVMIITTAIILSFGFVMVYVALTPTRRSLERKKRFISNISHELRTPLAIMRTNTEVALMHGDVPAKVQSILKRNIVEFDRISEIMNNLLGLSNLTQDGQIRFEEVDLNVVARQAMDLLTEAMEHKDITLALESHTKETVLGNAGALEQVVFNLIKNAVAHTNKGGVITIAVEAAADGKYIDLSVSDTGSGISRDELYHIFEPFYRARGEAKNGGQGLGLAIVNEIVQMHRGKIRVHKALKVTERL